MTPQPYIIQWNLNGISTRIRLGELQRLIKNFEPMCICLQHLGQYNTKINNYQLASESIKTDNELGTAIYVHNKITFEKIAIQNGLLQHSATQIHLGNRKKLTICNIYNQPNYNYNISEIKNVLTSLAQPILLLGDFNAHSPAWDENYTEADGPGKKIEDLLEEKNMSCLNEEDAITYLSNTNGATTAIDLTLCSDAITSEFDWRVLDDRYTSDHYPILLTYLNQQKPEKEKRYKINKADWI